MAWARWTALAVAALAAAGLAGCGSSQSGTDVKQVAFVSPGRDNEPDWTRQAQTALERAARPLGVRVAAADAAGADVAGVLERSAHDSQLVIAHDSRYAEAAEAVAKKTNVPELVWGERRDPPKGLVGEITVQDKAGGYFAGVVASGAAYSRRLAVVVVDDGSAWDLATWNRTAGGFVAGARSADPHVKLQYAQVGSHGDATAAQARAAANGTLAHGAQMILILGGREAIGAQRAVEATGGSGERLSIGVVTDKRSTLRPEEGGVPIMLGSIMWNAGPVFRRALADVRAGTFGQRPYALTFGNGGMSFYTTGRTPSDAVERGQAAVAKIERGAIQVPTTPTDEAVRALIAGGGQG